MTALTTDRDTPLREGVLAAHPVAASANIFVGALVALNATGFAAPGTLVAGLTAVGVAQEPADNSAGLDGDINVEVSRGVFRFDNSVANPVNRTHIGTTVYIEDDQTVRSLATAASAAGTVIDLDADGVWVEVG